MKTFTFDITLSGRGETEEEAWQDAVECFSSEPGVPDASYEEAPSRQDMELLVVNFLLERMESAEWVITHVYDGGDKVETLTKEDVIATVFSVDDSTIGFCKEGVRKVVYIVLGNDGYDCIADHSTGGEFEELMDEVQKFCDTLAEQ